MKVSIIIPVYKVETYIMDCINSVLNQTYSNLEVLLIDDCTPDKSMELARKCISDYQAKCQLFKDIKFVFLKHEYNRGLSAARNTGIEAATGDYLFFLDSDDIITEDCIDTLLREAKEGDYDVVCGNFIINGYVNEYWKNYQHKELRSHDKEKIIRHFVDQHVYMMAWNKLVRRKLITSKSLYFKEGIIHEDELWSLLLANQAISTCVISNVTYIYRVRDNSIINSKSKLKSFDSKVIILHEFQKEMKKGIIKNSPEIHYYLMMKRNRWIRGIFSCNELSKMEKMEYLLRIADLQYGISFSFKFLFSLCWQKIRSFFSLYFTKIIL